MKTLVVFYSRTGTTKLVAESLAKKLKAGVEEIVATGQRSGPLGYLASGMEASREKPAKIQPPEKDPKSYDILVVGTPVWAGKMSSPVRAYLLQQKGRFSDVAFFSTSGSGNGCFDGMERLCGRKPVASLALSTKEVRSGSWENKVADFSRKIKKPSLA